MEFRQLAYFSEVVRQGSLSAAARKLHITQPALSKAMKLLADEAGVPLFSMDGKRAAVTREGLVLYEQAQKILWEYEQTVNLLARLKAEHDGTVRVVTSLQRTALKRLTRLVTDFSATHEGTVIDLRAMPSREGKQALLDGEADIAIICDLLQEDSRFEGIVLERQALHLIVSIRDPLSEQRQADIADLRGRDILAYPPGYITHDVMTECCRHLGFEPRVRMVSSQPEILLAGAGQNLGVAVMGAPVSGEEAMDSIRSVPVREDHLRFALVALTVRDRERTAGTARFLDCLTRQRGVGFGGEGESGSLT